MSKKRAKALADVSLENVSGGSYFKYTLNDGTSLWCVYDENTGDFDPGYQTESDAQSADRNINGLSVRTEDRNINLHSMHTKDDNPAGFCS